MLARDGELRTLIKQIEEISPSNDPPPISLRREQFEVGLKDHPDIEYVTRFIEKIFKTGCKITENDIVTGGN